MNYLAHLALSSRDPYSLLGSLMGDFQKHLRNKVLSDAIEQAITQHREIDKFTDAHEVVIELKKCFSKQRRRFAPIIIDVSFDHFLSIHWDDFHAETREEFIRYAYDSLEQGSEYMPERMRRVLHYMISEDWLGSYMDISGVELTLNRLAGRIRFPNRIYDAIEEVTANYTELESGFLNFYPQLLLHNKELTI